MSFKEGNFLSSEKLGYLTLNDSGAVLVSGGDLENDEVKANIFYKMATLHDKFDKKGFPGPNGQCTRMTVIYDKFWYGICLSNKKLYVVKKLAADFGSSIEEDENIQVSIENSINS